MWVGSYLQLHTYGTQGVLRRSIISNFVEVYFYFEPQCFCSLKGNEFLSMKMKRKENIFEWDKVDPIRENRGLVGLSKSEALPPPGLLVRKQQGFRVRTTDLECNVGIYIPFLNL